MKVALHKFSLNTIQMHAPDYDIDVDGGSDSPTSGHLDLRLEPESGLHSDLKSNQYQWPPLISNRLVSAHVSPIPFQGIPAHPKKQRRTTHRKRSRSVLHHQD